MGSKIIEEISICVYVCVCIHVCVCVCVYVCVLLHLQEIQHCWFTFIYDHLNMVAKD